MTLPEQHPDRLAFAVASCHQPFKYKQPRGTVMWRALRAELIREQARFLLLVGDQVYADEAGQAWQQSLALSEDDPSRFAKRLRLYRSLYPQYLGLPDVREAMADIPQYMIWDDHEITNGWGSEPEHAYLAHQSIFQAARKAYVEFQHSHNPQNPSDPSALYYGFHVGKAAFLVLDLRGHRQSWNRQLLGDAQRDWIVRFVGTNAAHLSFFSSSPRSQCSIYLPDGHGFPRRTWPISGPTKSTRRTASGSWTDCSTGSRTVGLDRCSFWVETCMWARLRKRSFRALAEDRPGHEFADKQ